MDAIDIADTVDIINKFALELGRQRHELEGDELSTVTAKHDTETIGQSDSKAWHDKHRFIIGASNAHSFIGNELPESFMKKEWGMYGKFKTGAMDYGLRNEPKAFKLLQDTFVIT